MIVLTSAVFSTEGEIPPDKGYSARMEGGLGYGSVRRVLASRREALTYPRSRNTLANQVSHGVSPGFSLVIFIAWLLLMGL